MSAAIHLLCGKIGCGKTTFGRDLAREKRGILLSVDVWMTRLFGEHMPREIFEARLRVCKDLLYELAERIVGSGVDTILDFGFWSRSERDGLRERFAASTTPFIFYAFDLPDETLLARLRKRNEDLPSGTYEMTDEMFYVLSEKFERPSDDERCVMVIAAASLDRTS